MIPELALQIPIKYLHSKSQNRNSFCFRISSLRSRSKSRSTLSTEINPTQGYPLRHGNNSEAGIFQYLLSHPSFTNISQFLPQKRILAPRLSRVQRPTTKSSVHAFYIHVQAFVEETTYAGLSLRPLSFGVIVAVEYD